MKNPVGKLKGASSHEVDQKFGKGTLSWQRGYGVVSFAARDLPGVVRYIRDQKLHHQRGTTKAALEATDARD